LHKGDKVREKVLIAGRKGIIVFFESGKRNIGRDIEITASSYNTTKSFVHTIIQAIAIQPVLFPHVSEYLLKTSR